MTRKEAIKIIEQRQTCMECVVDGNCKDCDKAFDMAIEALRREDTFLDKVLEIIDEKIKFLEGRLQDGRFPIVKFAYQALRKDIEKLRGKEQ